MKKRLCAPPILRLCLLLLAVVQIAALLAAFERPAQAYIDPGSGFVFLQVAGSMLAGAAYYLRHRLKRILGAVRRPAQESSKVAASSEVAEPQS